MGIVATYPMGAFELATLERDRHPRYEKLLIIAEAYLQLGVSIWLDGNFSKKVLRRQFFDLLRKCGVPELVVLRCGCTEPELLEERFARRRSDPLQPDAKANNIVQHYNSVAQFEALSASEFQGLGAWEILVYDSCQKTLGERHHRTPLGDLVEAQLRHCNFISSERQLLL